MTSAYCISTPHAGAPANVWKIHSAIIWSSDVGPRLQPPLPFTPNPLWLTVEDTKHHHAAPFKQSSPSPRYWDEQYCQLLAVACLLLRLSLIHGLACQITRPLEPGIQTCSCSDCHTLPRQHNAALPDCHHVPCSEEMDVVVGQRPEQDECQQQRGVEDLSKEDTGPAAGQAKEDQAAAGQWWPCCSNSLLPVHPAYIKVCRS